MEFVVGITYYKSFGYKLTDGRSLPGKNIAQNNEIRWRATAIITYNHPTCYNWIPISTEIDY